ncbi:MAG: sterol desaturase family protein [Ignavibacteria bacterium]|nr:sterol desaturase family protein [Ignavibacteria bacterium]MBP6509577.1 sterol desaturase family protein [Candidatus Kapabacteria bacterium]MBK6419025.1 sterol desaturase family protein [Ignavibacteria bacterium]MBK6760291.1 sterol desaturase family protein [Ignavibacteria bacterium]MBK7185247.1 sterol desaturase family protein [Ignavibacteria bacterium]
MGIDLTWITLVITIFSAVIMIVLERCFPYTPGQRIFREGFLNDFVWYSLVQSYVLGLVIFGLIGWIDASTSLERYHIVRDLPMWLQVLVFFVVHDLYIYWFHRWQHRNGYLWRLHEAHHSTKDVDWLSGSRSHALEILINQTVEFLPIILLASPEVAVIKGCIDAVWGMYIHSNIDVRSGRLQRIFNGPEMHRWHHAIDVDAHDRNFSTKMAVWDWLFGTAYLPADRKPTGYGIGEGFPTNYMSQHAYAFRSFTSDRTGSGT